MKIQNPSIDRIFKAIADPTRRKIFHALLVGGAALSITEISVQHDISRQGVTKHIKTLEEARLIHIAKEGKQRLCTANPDTLKIIYDWVSYYDKFWDDALDRLDKHLDRK